MIRDTSYVRPLHEAENHFLEVLLERFRLTRVGSGTQLEVELDGMLDAVWSNHGRRAVRASIANLESRAKEYQPLLDDFLMRADAKTPALQWPPTERLPSAVGFPFRFASGGALPIVRMGRKEYYCLFYREIFPIGWNIANGGCDSREELMYPLKTVERELKEELIIIDSENSRYYTLTSDDGDLLLQPEHRIARDLIQEFFQDRIISLDDLEVCEVPIKWIDGPDSLRVSTKRGPKSKESDDHLTSGCFLNINAADFGIEIDRVAWIRLPDTAILVDGEILDSEEVPYRLVNAPIGLFDVERFNREFGELAESERRNGGIEEEFIPDFFFRSGRRYDCGEDIRHEVEKFVETLWDEDTVEREHFRREKEKFKLCPVTRSIVSRFLMSQSGAPIEQQGATVAGGVFLSSSSSDYQYTKELRDVLSNKLAVPVLFCEGDRRDANFSRWIDDSLDQAKHLVVVGTSLENISRQWVEYEWRSFHVDYFNGMKKAESNMLGFVSGIDPKDLPRPLRQNTAVSFERHGIESATNNLLPFLD